MLHAVDIPLHPPLFSFSKGRLASVRLMLAMHDAQRSVLCVPAAAKREASCENVRARTLPHILLPPWGHGGKTGAGVAGARERERERMHACGRREEGGEK